jgi:hypothetical protein
MVRQRKIPLCVAWWHTYLVIDPPLRSTLFVRTSMLATNGLGAEQIGAQGSRATTAAMDNANSMSVLRITVDTNMIEGE